MSVFQRSSSYATKVEALEGIVILLVSILTLEIYFYLAIMAAKPHMGNQSNRIKQHQKQMPKSIQSFQLAMFSYLGDDLLPMRLSGTCTGNCIKSIIPELDMHLAKYSTQNITHR